MKTAEEKKKMLLKNKKKTNKLVFYSNTNSKGKKDATGAFIPEAKAFAKLHSIPDSNVFGMDLINNNAEARRKFVVEKINESEGNIDCIAFFCHGWQSGIQFGINLKNMNTVIEPLSQKVGREPLKVIFFACLTAGNNVTNSDTSKIGVGSDGGFADVFRDNLVRYGDNYHIPAISEGWVDGHKTAGHTTWNPYVVRFYCSDVEDPELGAEGGKWVIAPKSKHWSKWVKELKAKDAFLRLSFSFMDVEDIEWYLDNL